MIMKKKTEEFITLLFVCLERLIDTRSNVIHSFVALTSFSVVLGSTQMISVKIAALILMFELLMQVHNFEARQKNKNNRLIIEIQQVTAIFRLEVQEWRLKVMAEMSENLNKKIRELENISK